MKEAFVQYVWDKQLFVTRSFRTEQNHAIEVIHSGQWSTLAGPDFFNAKLRIDEQVWAGNVEVHLCSSDWYRHNHEKDPRYDNVILHVVWEYDTPVFNSKGAEIPTLVVAKYIQAEIVSRCEQLFAPKATINCQTLLKDAVSPIVWQKWKETLYIERLENKTKAIEKLLTETAYNWNQVLFCFIAKSFGLNTNGDSFFELAKALPLQIVLKEGGELINIEALLFGMAGFLKGEEQEIVDMYYWNLVKRWTFYRHKYQLQERNNGEIHFFKLRPTNFPTIRLAQLASWLYHQKYRFNEVLDARDLSTLANLLHAEVSVYWEKHYTFKKESKRTSKKLTPAFQELLILNTIIPMQYAWASHKGNLEEAESSMEMSMQLKAESNHIITLFKQEGVKIEHAFDSQAILQLKKQYCTVNKCLSCAIGKAILNKKD